MATFLIDISCSSSKMYDQFLWSFESVIKDQLKNLRRFNIIKVQDSIIKFSESLVPVSSSSIEAAVEWLWSLQHLEPSQTFALPSAFQYAASLNENEAIYLFTENNTSIPAMETLLHLAESSPVPLNVVSYCCEKEADLNALAALAKRGRGTFHTYTIRMTVPNYQRSEVNFGAGKSGIVARNLHIGGPNKNWNKRRDCYLIFKELETCRDLLTRIKPLISNQPEPSKNSVSS
ncbi:hypothetical protein Ciccas_004508 [Cichlidogyrus casuarinus]|uniref:Uncharacterized protein n=1 Tax=Cichlidogyrus casuarinus TaxID=1844966 RepID=A0ABD2QBT3_9PLAT